GVREVIGRRLNALSAECNRMLTVAAVLGREFDFDILNRLTRAQESATGASDPPGPPVEDRLLGLLEEAIQARIINEDASSPGSYQFSHAMVLQTLTDELSVMRRARMHAQVATALEELYAERAEEHAPELAHHFCVAQPVTGPAKAIKYSLIAGHQALAAHSAEAALRSFLDGMEARGDQPLDREGAELLFGLGLAQAECLLPKESVKSLQTAFNYFLANGHRDRAVAVALYPRAGGTHLRPEAFQIAVAALPLVPPRSVQAAQLTLRSYVPDEAESRDRVDKAIEILRAAGDQAMEARAEATVARIEGNFLNWPDVLEHAQRAVELGRAISEIEAEILGSIWMTNAQLTVGDLTVASDFAAKAEEIAESMWDPFWKGSAALGVGRVSLASGDWAKGRGALRRGLEAIRYDNRVRAILSVIEIHSGDIDQAVDLLDSDLARGLGDISPQHDTDLAAVVGFHRTRDERLLQRALAIREIRLASHQSARSKRAVEVEHASNALLSVGQGDRGAADDAYRSCADMTGRIVYLNYSGDHILALLAGSLERPGEAAKHFEAALVLCRKMTRPPEIAWICHDYVEMLISSSGATGANDPAKIRALLGEGEQIDLLLDMKPLVTKFAGLRVKLAARRGGRPEYPDGLTEREVEVLRLIAGGRSNREIGDALVISENTVI
ncbi:MAG: hypothetical protein HY682_07000, partial [Chloroflexi bacterium]|nr:hypothetical protein [Chloroflexota bacterium]